MLSKATVAAIADLGVDGVGFDEDVRPALAAAALEPVEAQPEVNRGPYATSFFFPICRDHIRCTLDALDLSDKDVVERVLRFAARIAEVYLASPTANRAKIVRLHNALADDGYDMRDVNGGAVARVSINKREIARMMRGIQAEFDEHPIRVPISTEGFGPSAGGMGNTTIYNGPVIHGNATGAQLAWGNETVQQSQRSTEQVAPGFEAIAQAVAKTFEGLGSVGLDNDDRKYAEAAAKEMLAEVTRPQPDRGKVRRALTVLKGVLAPVAAGLAGGAATGAHDWARTAIGQLGTPF